MNLMLKYIHQFFTDWQIHLFQGYHNSISKFHIQHWSWRCRIKGPSNLKVHFLKYWKSCKFLSSTYENWKQKTARAVFTWSLIMRNRGLGGGFATLHLFISNQSSDLLTLYFFLNYYRLCSNLRSENSLDVYSS